MKSTVGFLGLGNIGSGVWQLLERRRDQLLERDQVEFEVKKVLVRSLNKARGVEIDDDTGESFTFFGDGKLFCLK